MTLTWQLDLPTNESLMNVTIDTSTIEGVHAVIYYYTSCESSTNNVDWFLLRLRQHWIGADMQINDQRSATWRNRGLVWPNRPGLWRWWICIGRRRPGRIWPLPISRGRGRIRACCCEERDNRFPAAIWNDWNGWRGNRNRCTAADCKFLGLIQSNQSVK